MRNKNNLDKFYENNTNNVIGFIESYTGYIAELLNNLDSQAVAEVIKQLEEARESENTVFIIGNGGSAATASHIGNDFGLAAIKIDPINKVKSIRALSLSDNQSVITAIGNDNGYENIFVDQLKVHFREGDKLIAISASGNSPNIIKAVEWVKENNGTTIGWSGFDGGKLFELSDYSVLIETPKGEYAPVEDLHMILDHIIVSWFQFTMINKKH